VAARLFEALGGAGLNVDLIVQATHEGASNDIAFTLAEDELEGALRVSREVLNAMGAGGAQLTAEGAMAKLSISGAGIMGRPGVAARLFDTLARLGINLRLIATSEVKVSCVVEGGQGTKALRAAAEAFELSEQQLLQSAVPCDPGDPAVRGVALDRDQVQVALRGVPDRPGAAATICRALADAGISLDAIVQSERTHGSGNQLSRDMSFTLRREDRHQAERALQSVLRELARRLVSRRVLPSPGSVPWGRACPAQRARRPACSAPWPMPASTSS
jgi:aspartate kinase